MVLCKKIKGMLMPILLELFLTFLKIGMFTIGGGYAMIPLIIEEVTTRGWGTMSEIIDYIAVAEATPGPFSINVATFVGLGQAGTLGVIAGVMGLVLPSFLLTLLIARFFTTMIEKRATKAALFGIRPAVIGLILAAALQVTLSTLNVDVSLPFRLMFSNINYVSLAIFVIVTFLAIFFKLNAYKIILISALLGLMLNLLLYI